MSTKSGRAKEFEVAPSAGRHYHWSMNSSNHPQVVFFCDCHHFSQVQLVLGDKLLGFMDTFYQQGGECLVSRGGRIVKYIGDSILAVFPEDAADDAVAAGSCIRKTYARLISEAGITVETDMEVGISYGEVVAGEVGHRSLRSFDLFGECVNEAAMIGHHRGIAVTDGLRNRLAPETRVRQLDAYQPKWRTTPLVVWEVVEE